jgi:hypothetical protein
VAWGGGGVQAVGCGEGRGEEGGGARHGQNLEGFRAFDLVDTVPYRFLFVFFPHF